MGEEAFSQLELSYNKNLAVYKNELLSQLWMHVVLFTPNRHICGVLCVLWVFL